MGGITAMKDIKNIKEQMEYIILPLTHSKAYDLCGFMGACPDSTSANCVDCIGEIPIHELAAIQEDLTRDNLEETIKIWEVLIR